MPSFGTDNIGESSRLEFKELLCGDSVKEGNMQKLQEMSWKIQMMTLVIEGKIKKYMQKLQEGDMSDDDIAMTKSLQVRKIGYQSHPIQSL